MSEERESFEAFSKRIRAAADSIPIRRGGQSTVLSKLSEADRKANIDRWYLEEKDPTSLVEAGVKSGTMIAALHDFQARAPSVDIPLEYWVGWVLRPYDGGWKLRRIRIPLHILEMFTTDQPTPADRREVIVAKVGVEAAHPSLTTKTDWGTPIGHTKDPVEPETVEMVDSYEVNQLGMRVPVYRRVTKTHYLALADEVRANHPLRP